MSKSPRTCDRIVPPDFSAIAEWVGVFKRELSNYPEFVNAYHRPVISESDGETVTLATGETVTLKPELVYMGDDEFAKFLRTAKAEGRVVGELIEKGQRKAGGQSIAVSAWGTDGQDVIGQVEIHEGHYGLNPMVTVVFFYRDGQGIIRHTSTSKEKETVTRPCGCVQSVEGFFGHFSNTTPEAVIDHLWAIMANPEWYGVWSSKGGKPVADQHQADPNMTTSIHEESRPNARPHWDGRRWGATNRPF